MTKWVWKGLQAGIKTTAYPRGLESAPGISPGRPQGRTRKDADSTRSLVGICPTGALKEVGEDISVDSARCIHCYRCKRQTPSLMSWEEGYEWAETMNRHQVLKSPFSRSLHIRIVDAGACGACLSEIKQITNPYYNIHRLGFFITPTPRTADVLLVAGPGTEHMRLPLEKVYDAMPTPKRVVAVGTCALTGGIFGPTFTTRAGVGEMVPVDVEIPGCPPPPLAIIHALLVTAGRRIPPGAPSPAEADKRGERS